MMPGWRNGKRCGLKSRWSQDLEGSSPSPGTNTKLSDFARPIRRREARKGMAREARHQFRSKNVRAELYNSTKTKLYGFLRARSWARKVPPIYIQSFADDA